MSIRSVRRGYALLDFVVALAVIGLVVALLLPAIAQSRMAAAEDVCSDNLRVLGKGFLAFERDQGGFPPRRTGGMGNRAYGGWGAELLPYVDAKLADQYKADYDFYDPLNKTVVENSIATFVCPAAPPDRKVLINSNASGNSPNPDKNTLFSANCGPNDYISSNGLLFPRIGYGMSWPAELNGNQHQSMTDAVNLPASQIVDGLSNTIMLIEKAGAPQQWRMGKKKSGPDLFAGQNNSRGTWAGYGSIAFGVHNPEDGERNARGDDSDCTVNCNNTFGIYGFHTDGANILLCDGSVRFVRKSLDGLTFLRLTVRDDGQLIAPDSF